MATLIDLITIETVLTKAPFDYNISFSRIFGLAPNLSLSIEYLAHGKKPCIESDMKDGKG